MYGQYVIISLTVRFKVKIQCFILYNAMSLLTIVVLGLGSSGDIGLTRQSQDVYPTFREYIYMVNAWQTLFHSSLFLASNKKLTTGLPPLFHCTASNAES